MMIAEVTGKAPGTVPDTVKHDENSDEDVELQDSDEDIERVEC